MENSDIFHGLFVSYLAHSSGDSYVNSRGLCMALQHCGRSVFSLLLLFFSFATFEFTLDWTNFSANRYIEVEIVLGAGKIERYRRKTLYRGTL